ncbi:MULTISPECIES: thioredoxin [Ornithinimicrobium]|uniref:Thioredoxin n=1 Tax=Ornithinimicrobium kibberense TaxID=282060 RepID=A0ABV5V1E3_9MICO|nr:MULTISPECIES: thioredoxin [Ornithinimicrobium]OLT19568.1 thioredoxin [Ornithinimicrobium sp. CNJ-824]
MAIIQTSDATFTEDVLQHDGPVLVDFWAPWCGPCKMIAPVLEELSKEWGDKLTIAKLNTDDNPETTRAYGITGIPTMNVYQGGQVVKTLVGALPKKKLAKEMEPFTS